MKHKLIDFLAFIGYGFIDFVTRGCHVIADFGAYLIDRWDGECENAERITNTEKFLSETTHTLDPLSDALFKRAVVEGLNPRQPGLPALPKSTDKVPDYLQDDTQWIIDQESPMPYGHRANPPNRRRDTGHITQAQTDLLEDLLLEADTTLESVMEALGLMFLGDDISQLGFDDASEATHYLLQRRRVRDT